MGLFDIFKGSPVRVNEDNKTTEMRKQQSLIFENYISGMKKETAFKAYALQLCINRISNAIVKCDFNTFNKGTNEPGTVWYQLNVEPNQNQNAADFWNKVIEQMVMNEEGALIVQDSMTGELLAADSFTVKKYAFKPNSYAYVLINGYTIQHSFSEKEVMHLRLNNSKIKAIFDGIYSEYSTFLDGAIRNYNRSNAIKYALNIDATFDQLKNKPVLDEDGNQVIKDGLPLTEYDDVIDDMFENRLKPVFSEKDSVTPLESGLGLSDLNATGNSKSSGSAANKTTRDISAMVDDIINMAADAFAIPRGLLKGDTADVNSMTDNFISLCINPIAEQIEDEINRKLYGKDNVLKHTYCRVKTEHIRNSDITKLATSAELMSRIGAWSLNDILAFIGEESINEDWADKHIMSKNYALIEDALKGGENNEENQDNV